MVEHERNTAGTMPNGRVMLRSIFKHFQLERDRIGILGERNLLGLKLAGQSVADIEAFREKYNYILRAIPLDELPKERTLFNHLMDEFEKCPIMKHRVEKARESAHDSHRRTCAWLWAKADLAIELAQQSATVMSLIKMLSSNRLFVARARKQLPALCQQRLRRRRRRTRKVIRKGIKGRIKAAPQPLLRLKVKVLRTLSLLLRSPKMQTRETLPLLISRRGRRLCPRQQRCQPLKRQKFRVCSMPMMRVGLSPAPSSTRRPRSTLGHLHGPSVRRNLRPLLPP